MGCSNSPQSKEIKFPNHKLIIERQDLEPKKTDKGIENQTKHNQESKQLLKDEVKEDDIGNLTTQKTVIKIL